MGKTITNYEDMRMLFEYMKVKNLHVFHWLDSSAMQMIEAFGRVILHATKDVMSKAKVLSLRCDEVTMSNGSTFFICL
jgi:hypothetical protein